MMPKSKLCFWIMLLAAGGSFLWCLWFPYSEQRLLAAIPGNARFISSHDHIGKRWPNIAEGSMAEIAESFAGSGRSAFVKSRISGFALKMFAGRKTVSAYVPNPLQNNPGSWVFVTWAGANSQLLRWNLVHPFFGTVSKAILPDGGVYWRIGDGDNRMLAACRDGYLLGVVEDDPGLLQRMLNRMDSYSSGDNSIAGARLKRAGARYPDCSDTASLSVPMTFSSNAECLLALGPQADGVRIFGAVEKPVSLNGNLPVDAAAAAGVCGDSVDAIALMQWRSMRDIITSGEPDKPGAVISFLNDVSSEDALMFTGLMNDQFSGRMYNLKVPVLLAGVEVQDGIDVMQEIYDLMDRLNAEKGLGVIPIKMPTEDGQIIVAGGSKMNLFGDTKHRPSLTVRDGWLIVSSDMESLLYVLQQQDSNNPVEGARWAKLLSNEKGGAGVYVDFKASEQSIRNALAVYTLFLIAEGESTAEKRAGLDVLRSVIETLAEVGEVVLSASSGDQQELAVRLLLGPKAGL